MQNFDINRGPFAHQNQFLRGLARRVAFQSLREEKPPSLLKAKESLQEKVRKFTFLMAVFAGTYVYITWFQGPLKYGPQSFASKVIVKI